MHAAKRTIPLVLLASVPFALAITAACGDAGSTFIDDPEGPRRDAGGAEQPDGGLSDTSSSSSGGTSGGPVEPGCGNGLVESGEACDDGNTVAGDGCAADCSAIEVGFHCAREGAACAAICGDGLVVGIEACDDGNLTDNNNNALPGCSDTCQLEEGYKCPTPGEACVPTVCGDGVVEGTEACDDGNNVPFDGCYNCQLEPTCNGNGCTGVCGDGVIFPGEDCDDGNTRDGDGCSSDCKLERGFSCENRAEALPDELVLPVIYRDFKSPFFNNNNATVALGEQLNPDGHPDFERMGGYGLTTGLVKDRLGADGRPQFNDAFDPCVNGPGAPYDNVRKCQQLTGPDEFYEWFHDDRVTAGVLDPSKPVRNMRVIDTLTLRRLPNTDSYQFDSNQAPYAPFSFFPLDNKGFGIEQGRVCRDDIWGNAGQDWTRLRPAICDGSRIKNEPRCANALDRLGQPNFDYSCVEFTGERHNFLYTSELHFWFTYTPTAANEQAPVLSFSGDDDVWIFINGRLVVDLGGLHAYLSQSYELTNARAQQLGLEPGGVYDIALFHAERRSHASNFKFTLGGFIKARTFCEPVCGDGIKTANEACDLGSENNIGGYGGCTASCEHGPRCGDGVVQREHGEVCDDGNVIDGDRCSADCRQANIIN